MTTSMEALEWPTVPPSPPSGRGTRPLVRLPFAPLERAAARRVRGEVTASAVGRMLGTTGTNVRGMRCRGYVSIERGDVFVTALGLHPMDVWGDLWLAALEDAAVGPLVQSKRLRVTLPDSLHELVQAEARRCRITMAEVLRRRLEASFENIGAGVAAEDDRLREIDRLRA